MAGPDASVSNDPFLSHTNPVNYGGSRKAQQAQPPQELANVASDAFMTKLSGPPGVPRNNKVSIKVNIISASNLRAADWLTGKSDPFVICQIPKKSRSQFRTKTLNKNLNPVWNEYGHALPGWVPGDPIKFSVFDSDTFKSDDSLGEAVLESRQFYPNGFKGNLTLRDKAHTDVSGSTLNVQIEVFGVTAGDRFEMGLMRAEDTAKKMALGLEHGLEDCAAGCASLPGEAIEYTATVVGDPDPERKPQYLWTMILVPWGVFMWILLCWEVLQHFTSLGAVLLTAVALAISLGCIIVGVSYKKGEKSVPFSTMGVLCLIAVCAGIMAGQYGWYTCWRQYWWTITGYQYPGSTASTPAASRIDAAWVGFSTSTTGKEANSTNGGTSVDTFRASGYRYKGTWYCAAPILDPTLVAGTIWSRVEYWAIGINCCQNYGSFTCDASREYQGGYGVVMVDEGMPCAGCNRDKFRLAAAKSEGVYNLVSSPGARYVRFVRLPGVVRNEYLFKCLLNIFGSTLLSAFGFAALGKLAHYKGIGKKGRMPNFSFGALTGKKPLLV